MTTDRYADLTAIVKRRYETGEYGDAHFKLPRAVYDEMRQHVPTPEPGTYAPPRLPGYSLGDLMGIPILIAEDLPEGTWQLVQTGSGEILRAGAIDQPDPDGVRESTHPLVSADICTGPDTLSWADAAARVSADAQAIEVSREDLAEREGQRYADLADETGDDRG